MMLAVEPLAWAETERKLVELKQAFCQLHETPMKNFTPEQVAHQRALQLAGVELHNERIALLLNARKA